MNKSRYLIVIALIFFTNIAYSFDIENKILIKIENEIITSLDIQNEYKYLIGSKKNTSYLKKKYNFEFKIFGNKLIKKMSISL